MTPRRFGPLLEWVRFGRPEMQVLPSKMQTSVLYYSIVLCFCHVGFSCWNKHIISNHVDSNHVNLFYLLQQSGVCVWMFVSVTPLHALERESFVQNYFTVLIPYFLMSTNILVSFYLLQHIPLATIVALQTLEIPIKRMMDVVVFQSKITPQEIIGSCLLVVSVMHMYDITKHDFVSLGLLKIGLNVLIKYAWEMITLTRDVTEQSLVTGSIIMWMTSVCLNTLNTPPETTTLDDFPILLSILSSIGAASLTKAQFNANIYIHQNNLAWCICLNRITSGVLSSWMEHDTLSQTQWLAFVVSVSLCGYFSTFG